MAKNGKVCEKIFYIFSHIFPIPIYDLDNPGTLVVGSTLRYGVKVGLNQDEARAFDARWPENRGRNEGVWVS